VNVLCNSEVLDVDQDSLGKQAKVVRHSTADFVLVKDLNDGSKAVGIFNLGEQPQTLSVSWPDLGVSGTQRVRDMWRQKDIGLLGNEFHADVRPHGVELVRLWPVR
jgi:alpha-galactosidase